MLEGCLLPRYFLPTFPKNLGALAFKAHLDDLLVFSICRSSGAMWLWALLPVILAVGGSVGFWAVWVFNKKKLFFSKGRGCCLFKHDSGSATGILTKSGFLKRDTYETLCQGSHNHPSRVSSRPRLRSGWLYIRGQSTVDSLCLHGGTEAFCLWGWPG